ncbi:hypothetical protein SMMN14_02613 [Sphaerulina musiva]
MLFFSKFSLASLLMVASLAPTVLAACNTASDCTSPFPKCMICPGTENKCVSGAECGSNTPATCRCT